MNTQDTFREHVQTLVAEGKLTPEEAEQLLHAGGAENDTAIPQPPAPPAAPAPPTLTGLVDAESIPLNLELSVTGYSLTVRRDPGVSVPQLSASIEERLELLGTPQGWRVARKPLPTHGRGEGWLERVIGGFMQEGNLRAELLVPEGVSEVRAKVQGGNLTLPDLEAPVHATVQGGNLTLGNTRELHAKVQGGNLKWTATLTDGTHQLKVQGGNVNLDLQPGSSVRLSGDVTAGNLSAKGFHVTQHTRDFVHTAYSGVLQDGQATLDLRVQGGNAKVVAS